MRAAYFALALALSAPLALPLAYAADAPPVTSTAESARIEGLLSHIAGLKGAQFVRNGEAYSASDAAAHLRMKLGKAGKRVRTAEDFVRLCATGSYLSGKPYQIVLAGKAPQAAGPYLMAQLAAQRAAK